ncbi:unnamed protein product [marine sediment metagenome]|uniref:Uncharacterized protein n=1 Tax=marine sediment metagenome TaxID=412755 RepID=X1HXM7_9ZZZZ
MLILSHHLEKSVDEEGELSAQIVGVARNNSAAELQYAEVIGKFYDKHGTLLATGLAKTVSEEGESFTLDPGQIWDFTIAYSAETEAHPSLKILSCKLEKDGSTAKAVGEVQNDGDVMLSYAQITATFYDSTGSELTTGTTGIVDLEVGETRGYTIFYPGSNYKEVDHVTAVVGDLTTTNYAEPEEIHHTTVQVGALRGSTVMP